MSRAVHAVVLVPLLAFALPSACSKPAAAPKPVLVFAAASLTAPFQAIAKEFEQRHPDAKIELDFEGTPQLVMKVVQQGATADVLASADEPNMQKVVQAGKTARAPQVFARNRLAIVVGNDNPKAIRTLADLARPELRVVLCGPEVPAGKYARQALAKASVTVHSSSDEPSVRAVVTKVQLGEADAGIVYATDTIAADGRVGSVAIPDEHNVVATYPIAVLSGGANTSLGEQFVAWVLSADGRRTLQSFGFQAP